MAFRHDDTGMDCERCGRRECMRVYLTQAWDDLGHIHGWTASVTVDMQRAAVAEAVACAQRGVDNARNDL